MNPLKLVKKAPITISKSKRLAGKQPAAEPKKLTAMDLIPIKDITNNMCIRRDGHLVMGIYIHPQNITLLSKKEKRALISKVHEVVNGQSIKFSIWVIGKPIDLDSYIGWLQGKAKDTDHYLRKKLLQGYIRQAASIAASGESLEQNHYVILTREPDKHAAEELLSRAKELIENFKDAKIECQLCTTEELTSMNFLFTHPAQAAFERVEIGPYLPTQVDWDM